MQTLLRFLCLLAIALVAALAIMTAVAWCTHEPLTEDGIAP